MPRTMENGQPKIDIREENGKFYAYSSTSVMVDGKKVTQTTYYGRYDPVTGNITPKKARGKQRPKDVKEEVRKELTVIDMLKGVDSREFGSAYLLDFVQHDARIGRDLFLSFGPDVSRTILAGSMALVLQDGGAFSHIEDTLDRSMVRQMYNLRSDLNSDELTGFTHNLGVCNSNIDDFFRLRVQGCGDLISWDSTTKGTYSTCSGLADYLKNNKDNEDIPQIKKAFASSRQGVPVMFELYPGTMSDMATLKDFVDRIRRYKADDIIYVMDRGYGSGANIRYMIDKGVRFVVPADTDSKAVKSLLTEFNGPNRSHMVFDDHAYDVWETDLALVMSKRTNVDGTPAYDFVRISDAPDGSELIKAFVCFDTAKRSDEVQNLRLLIHDLSKRFDVLDSPDPMRDFKAMAGKASKFFEAEPEGRGLKYRVRTNAVSFAENRAGTFVMLSTPNMDWEEMMSAYDARRLVEQNIDFDKTSWKRFYSSDPASMLGREFVRFVALILKCHLNHLLRSGGLRQGPSDVINSMGSITAMGRDNEWIVKNVCKKHRTVFEAIGLDIPDAVPIGIPIHTQEEVDEAIQSGV